ncbi:MAG: GNAT family acetyltransferase [Halieaceae bacterium]|nr:GNAT family acetyltransferase [Halieaceae bacterium]
MFVRKYTEGDRDGLVQLWAETFPDDPPHNEPARMIAAKVLVDDLIFVAEEKGRVIGACMAGYDGHRGWLYAVAVAKDRRRGGIGKRLIEQAVESLKEMGCIKVNLQIRAANREVQAFYESLGFVVEDRISMGALMHGC